MYLCYSKGLLSAEKMNSISRQQEREQKGMLSLLLGIECRWFLGNTRSDLINEYHWGRYTVYSRTREGPWQSSHV